MADTNIPETSVSGSDAVHKHLQIPTWLSKVVGSSFVILGLITFGVLTLGGYFVHRIMTTQTEMKNNQDLMLANLRILNEQAKISEIVREKLGEKIPSDQVSRISFEIYDGCRRYNMKPELVLAVIDKESSWNPNAVSNMGAIGLMQCMPDTAIKYFKSRGMTMTMDSLRDPVNNVITGIEVLNDKHEAAMIQGKDTQDSFVTALFYYCGKGDTYAREVLALTASYQKKLTTPLTK